MSFILDALKKLEREKRSAEPGVVMVGPVLAAAHWLVFESTTKRVVLCAASSTFSASTSSP